MEDLNKFAKSVFNTKKRRWEKLQEETENIQYELTGNDILAKLMMKTKGLRKRENLPFGLYHKNDKYFADRTINQKKKNHCWNSNHLRKGLKAVSFIKSNEKFDDIKEFTKLIKLKKRNEIWLSSGRTLGEKVFCFLKMANWLLTDFYEFHWNSIQKKINQLKIDIKTSTVDLQNDLKLGLLRGDFEIQPLPK